MNFWGRCLVESMFRLDQPCRRLSGAREYFSMHMKSGEYLTQDGQCEMVWVGNGSDLLGLQGQVVLEHFERLCAKASILTLEIN